MTARITQAELVQAATLAKTEGVTVTITAPNGKTYTIAPVVDVKGESDDAADSWFDRRKAKREANRAGRA